MMEDNNNTPKTSKNSLSKRIFAILFLGIYLVLFGIFVYMLFSGSNYVIQMLFVIIVFPVIMYLFVWLRKVFDNFGNNDKEEEK
jgi:succinate-acetate transporter protein